jgi:hypothetical protein
MDKLIEKYGEILLTEQKSPSVIVMPNDAKDKMMNVFNEFSSDANNGQKELLLS